MKNLLFLMFLLPAGLVVAADPVPAAREMVSVEQFLSLSDTDLDQLQQVIVRIRAMTPEQRAELRREIGQYRELPGAQREQLRMGWGWMPREIQDGWREMMQGATPERRTAIQQELQALAPDEKAERRRQLVQDYLKAKPARP
jgi:hypothetical protein